MAKGMRSTWNRKRPYTYSGMSHEQVYIGEKAAEAREAVMGDTVVTDDVLGTLPIDMGDYILKIGDDYYFRADHVHMLNIRLEEAELRASVPQPSPQPDAGKASCTPNAPGGCFACTQSNAVAPDAPVAHGGHTAVSGNTRSDSGSNHVSDCPSTQGHIGANVSSTQGYSHDDAMRDPQCNGELRAYVERLEASLAYNIEALTKADRALVDAGRWKAKAEWLAIQLEHRSADLWEAWLLSAEEATR